MTAAQIIISVDEKGHLSVTGPITNKGLCYSLLECAKDVVREQCDAAARASQIAVVGADELPDRRRDSARAFEVRV